MNIEKLRKTLLLVAVSGAMISPMAGFAAEHQKTQTPAAGSEHMSAPAAMKGHGEMSHQATAMKGHPETHHPAAAVPKPAKPMPESRREERHEREGFAWVPGDYFWDGTDWVWADGYWLSDPWADAIWVPGHWVHRWYGEVWIPGHWA